MMITMLFYLDLSEKKFCQNILKSKNFEQKLPDQVVEAEALRVEAEAIQKLPLPHPRDSKTKKLFHMKKIKIKT